MPRNQSAVPAPPGAGLGRARSIGSSLWRRRWVPTGTRGWIHTLAAELPGIQSCPSVREPMGFCNDLTRGAASLFCIIIF